MDVNIVVIGCGVDDVGRCVVAGVTTPVLYVSTRTWSAGSSGVEP